MYLFQKLVILCLLGWIYQVSAIDKQIINVELGGHCALGAAPVGPGGSWQVVEKNVEKICPAGSSCRRGACNCNDLEDGTVTSMASDDNGIRSCKRVAGQKCSSSEECFSGVQCLEGVCTCPDKKLNSTFGCVDRKYDVTILAK